jgi:hypothetical protein
MFLMNLVHEKARKVNAGQECPVTINFKKAVLRFRDGNPASGVLEFRMDGSSEWQWRRVLESHSDETHVYFACDDGPESDGPYVVIGPRGTVRTYR